MDDPGLTVGVMTIGALGLVEGVITIGVPGLAVGVLNGEEEEQDSVEILLLNCVCIRWYLAISAGDVGRPEVEGTHVVEATDPR